MHHDLLYRGLTRLPIADHNVPWTSRGFSPAPLPDQLSRGAPTRGRHTEEGNRSAAADGTRGKFAWTPQLRRTPRRHQHGKGQSTAVRVSVWSFHAMAEREQKWTE